MRLIRRVLALGAMAALVAIGTPSAGAQTPTVEEVIGSADGLTVGLGINDTGINVGPDPTVTLPPEGGLVSDSVVGVAADVLGVSLTSGTLNAEAEGALGPEGFATASSSVEDLALFIDIADVFATNLILAEVISAECSSNLGGVVGDTTIVGLSILNTPIFVAAPNTQIGPIGIDIPNVASASISGVVNGQVENPDGSLSVTALSLEVSVEVLDIVSVEGLVELGPATCGVVEGEIPPDGGVTPPPVEPGAPAQPVTVTPRFTG